MKTNIIFVFCMLLAHLSGAQTISLRNDTIYSGLEKYALFTKSPRPPYLYSVLSLNGEPLMTIHNSRIEVKGDAGYVVTFLNDKKQGIIGGQPNFPQSVIAELVKCKLVAKGKFVDLAAKDAFLSTHPLPPGYTDVDQLIEY